MNNLVVLVSCDGLCVLNRIRVQVFAYSHFSSMIGWGQASWGGGGYGVVAVGSCWSERWGKGGWGNVDWSQGSAWHGCGKAPYEKGKGKGMAKAKKKAKVHENSVEDR